MKKVAVIGAGGHGRVVADIIRCMQAAGQDVSFAGYIDRVPLDGVIGGDDDLAALKAAGTVNAFIVGIGSVRGGNGPRVRVFSEALASGLEAFCAVHPAAILAADTSLAPGVAVMAGAILNPGVAVEENAIVNTGAVIDHDGRIGAHSHVAPGVVMSGDVTVGARSLIGTGASVRQGITIGADTTVGTGAVVVKDVADGQTVTGNPARPH